MGTMQNEADIRDQLLIEAEKLGVPYRGLPHNNMGLMDAGLLQERIQNFKTARRASRTWWISLASAVASAASALAAWAAVVSNSN